MQAVWWRSQVMCSVNISVNYISFYTSLFPLSPDEVRMVASHCCSWSRWWVWYLWHKVVTTLILVVFALVWPKLMQHFLLHWKFLWSFLLQPHRYVVNFWCLQLEISATWEHMWIYHMSDHVQKVLVQSTSWSGKIVVATAGVSTTQGHLIEQQIVIKCPWTDVNSMIPLVYDFVLVFARDLVQFDPAKSINRTALPQLGNSSLCWDNTFICTTFWCICVLRNIGLFWFWFWSG